MSKLSRRKLLKSMAAGSGAVVAGKSLPDTWTRPVVDSVLLPAHAQTSGIYYCGDFDEDYGVFSVRIEGDTAYVKGVQGGWQNHEPLYTYKYEWQGTAVKTSNWGWTGTISATNLSTTSCEPGGSFRATRDILIVIPDTGIGVSISVEEGDGTLYPYPLTPSSSECLLPGVTDCTEEEEMTGGG